MQGSRIRRWAAMTVLLSGSPGQTLLFAALGGALPLLATRFDQDGNGAFMAQMMMTMPALGVILGGAVSGLAIERWGVRAVLYASLAAYAIFGAGGLYLDNSAALLASRFLLGVAVAHHSPCVLILLADWFDECARARLLGFQGAVSGIVSVIAGISGGALAEWAGWRGPFAIYLLALPILACAVFTVRAAPRPQGPTRAARRGAVLPLWPIYAVIVPVYIALLMTSIQLSFLLAADGVTSALSRSWVIAMGSIGSTLSGAAFGYLFVRLGPRRTRIALASLMALGFLIVGAGAGLASVAAGCLIAGLGGGMLTPYVSGLLLSKAAPEIRGRALGLMYTSVYVADFLNPVVVAPVRQVIGIHGAFFAVGAALAVGVLAIAIYRPRGPIIAPIAGESGSP